MVECKNKFGLTHFSGPRQLIVLVQLSSAPSAREHVTKDCPIKNAPIWRRVMRKFGQDRLRWNRAQCDRQQTPDLTGILLSVTRPELS